MQDLIWTFITRSRFRSVATPPGWDTDPAQAPLPSILKSFYTRSRCLSRLYLYYLHEEMEALRGLSTRKQRNARVSRRYKKNIAGGGEVGGGGVAGHSKIAKILHIPQKQCTWLLIECCLDLFAIYNNHSVTNFNSLDRMMLNSSTTSSLIGIAKPCFYYRRPKMHLPGLGNVLRRQLKSKWPKHHPKDFHVQGHFLLIGCVSVLPFLGPKELNTTMSSRLAHLYWDGCCFERMKVWAGNVYRAHNNTDR